MELGKRASTTSVDDLLAKCTFDGDSVIPTFDSLYNAFHQYHSNFGQTISLPPRLSNGLVFSDVVKVPAPTSGCIKFPIAPRVMPQLVDLTGSDSASTKSFHTPSKKKFFTNSDDYSRGMTTMHGSSKIGSVKMDVDKDLSSVCRNDIIVVPQNSSRKCSQEWIESLQDSSLSSTSTYSDSAMDVDDSTEIDSSVKQAVMSNSKIADELPLVPQPEGVKIPLYDYQLQGLGWITKMLYCEESNGRSIRGPFKGCILGDEMGLGKTLQAISFMVSSPVALTLIIAPLTLLDQWMKDIADATQNGAVEVFKYHGNKRDENLKILLHNLKTGFYGKRSLVILTTFTMIGAGAIQVRNGPKIDYDFGNNILMNISWNRVIVDEAHNLRSKKSMSFRAVCRVSCQSMLLLTGTPVVNSIDDFFSLLCLIRHPVYSDTKTWRIDIARPLQNPLKVADYNESKDKLESLVESCMLRRVKGQSVLGKKITELPPVTYKILEVDLVKDSPEELFYSAVRADAHSKFESIGDADIGKNYSVILSLLMRLRLAACHPFLVALSLNAERLSISSEIDWIQLNSQCGRIVDYHVQQQFKEEGDDRQKQKQNRPIEIDLTQSSSSESDQNYHAEKSPTTIPKTLGYIDWSTSSSKLNKLVELVSNILTQSTDEKIIIFSQFVNFIWIVFNELRMFFPSCEVLVMEGKTDSKARDDIIDRFKKNKNSRILLLSLKAGGVGLNLSVANHAILLDSWWNTPVELQAQDRVNRVGQTRPVTIYKFLIKGTIEERVELIKAKKDASFGVSSQISSSSHDLASSSPSIISQLTIEELRGMFLPVIGKKPSPN